MGSVHEAAYSWAAQAWAGEDGPFLLSSHDDGGTTDAPDPLEEELRAALAGNRFRLRWQAVVQCQTGDLAGFEAVVRWDRTGRPGTPSSMFMPVLGRLNLLRRFDQWLLHKACAAAAAWPGHALAVGVSPTWLEGQGLIATVASALERSGLAPALLTLDLSEAGVAFSPLSEAGRAAARDLHRLKALGVRLSLDDFGACRTALGTLHDTPYDVMKLDARLVGRLGRCRRTEAIVRAMLQMAKALDLVTCARGVERADQLAILQAYGCDQVQGGLIGQPEDQVPDLLDLYDRLDQSRMFLRTAAAGAGALM